MKYYIINWSFAAVIMFIITAAVVLVNVMHRQDQMKIFEQCLRRDMQYYDGGCVDKGIQISSIVEKRAREDCVSQPRYSWVDENCVYK